jgi:hypothetical protein
MQELSPEERKDLASLDTRELAFQIWTLLADRKPKETVNILKRDFGITDVSPALVSQWKIRGNWDIKARQLLYDQAPSLVERTAATLFGSAPAAMAWLRDAGQRAPHTLNPRGEVDRGAVVANVAILDRAGFLPNTRKDAQKSGVPGLSASGSDTWSAMSDAELDAIISGRVNPADDTES